MAELLELGTSHIRSSRQPRGAKAGVYAVTLALHVVVILSFLYIPRVEVGAIGDGPARGGIAAFIDPGATGTTGMAEPEVRKVTLVSAKTTARPPKPAETPGDAGQGGGSADGVEP
jgi:hypothetical protein